ncbi:hypothetical protein GGR52DRAFT_521603 [Hypoxylon sp. FL1284]|nr:hypothetical protein GGR52DRAFT_521603 [Hypoxylon sp. FL1284]
MCLLMRPSEQHHLRTKRRSRKRTVPNAHPAESHKVPSVKHMPNVPLHFTSRHPHPPLHIHEDQQSIDDLQLAASTHDQQNMAYREIYIYPNSSLHITFPVVDYTAGRRAPSSPPRPPTCYMAIAPPGAKPIDIQESLAPEDSRRTVLARLFQTGRTAPLSKFEDIAQLRAASIQLEIWDNDGGH